VAPLQKGLVLVFDGNELIEEGVGFGVPVVKYKNKTYFSSSAYCSIDKNENGISLTKLFVLDTISRKRVGKSSYVNDEFYRFLHKLFEKAYLGSKRFFPFLGKVMELRQVLGIQTKFIRVEPKGAISVKFTIQQSSIEVQVDLSSLDKVGCEEILILNEQGSTFFGEYTDSEGLKLCDAKIGAWNEVRAKDASLSHIKGSLAFGLEKRDGSLLFRGWEKTKGRFAWTGLSYSLPPQLSLFDYVIRLKIPNQNYGTTLTKCSLPNKNAGIMNEKLRQI
jgi:hypothetical protein